MRRGITKAVSVMVAAALACSMVPASALAADEATSGSSTLGVKLKYLHLSVDAPAQIVFCAADGTSLDVSERDDWDTATLQASVPFVNRSECGVYLADATMKQTANDNVGKLFNGLSGTVGSSDHPFLTLSNGDASATIAQTKTTDSEKPMDFGENNKILNQLLFFIAEASDGGETKGEFTLTLDMAAANLKADDGLEGYLDDTSTDFCSFMWTFAADPGFYLAINSEPQSEALNSWAGQEFTLEQVRADSKALGSGAAAQDSDTYKRYYAMATSMAPEGDYTCYVRYGSEFHRLRLIGLNQDYAAGYFGTVNASYALGDRVGLTFQFLELIENTKMQETEAMVGEMFSWNSEAGALLREKLQPNGEYYDKLETSLQNAIVPVTKFSAPANTGDSACTVPIPWAAPLSQRMFIPSRCEMMGSTSYKQQYKRLNSNWLCEGAGAIVYRADGLGRQNNGEQYLFYSNKTFGQKYYTRYILNSNPDGACLFTPDTSAGSDSNGRCDYWLRTAYLRFNTGDQREDGPCWSFIGLDGTIPDDNHTACKNATSVAGVLPSFCL